LAEFLAGQAEVSHDNGRTPMQWNTGLKAGFTSGTPWLKINPNHATVNVEAAGKDPNSVLNYFRKMIRLRKSEPALVYGKFDLLDAENPDIFAYTRSLEGRTLLVALSFNTKGGGVALPTGFKAGKVPINNLTESPVQGNNLVPKPYQAVVMEAGK
jgi:oligo-1,6-glucosidase